MGRRLLENFQKQLVKRAIHPLYFLYISLIYFVLKMYGLYDKEGILRFIDPDKEACIAYAELFELGSTNYCLMDLTRNAKKLKCTNLDQNQGGNSN